MNVLSTEKRVQLVSCLVEGMSLRATGRVCDVAFNTVLKFVPWIGRACSDFQDTTLRGLTCDVLQVDEQWNFCLAKDRNLPKEKVGKFGFGSVWTWCAIDARSRLVPSWFVGDRTMSSAVLFLEDLSNRLVNRPQIVADGLAHYPVAIETVFGSNADFATVIKQYGPNSDLNPAVRYSQPPCIGVKRNAVSGEPDMKRASTSYVERLNLQMRMSVRRCTRLTNAHSKKIANHVHALSLFFMHYNFCRRHESLRVSPAMAAGVTDHLWSLEEVVSLAGSSQAGQIAA